MFPLTPQTTLLFLAALVAVLGCVSLALGLYMLVARGYASEMKIIAAQSARLGQKGLSEEVAALVANSSRLLDSINSLVRTSAGIGVFLVVVGVILLAGSYFILNQMAWGF